jgi:hypothetical protein
MGIRYYIFLRYAPDSPDIGFLFAIPTYFSFKVKQPIFFFLINGLIFLADYAVQIKTTSDDFNDVNGKQYILLSLLFFIAFFYKKIMLVFKAQIN